MKRNVSIVDSVTDPQLLGLSISKPQETLLRAIYGLPLPRSMLEIWQQCTGREIAFRHGFSEATIICGARSGKDSWIVTPTAAFEARSRLINPHTGEKRFEILGKLSQIFTGKSLRI